MKTRILLVVVVFIVSLTISSIWVTPTFASGTCQFECNQQFGGLYTASVGCHCGASIDCCEAGDVGQAYIMECCNAQGNCFGATQCGLCLPPNCHRLH
jgi:hypothetical protein